RSLLFSHRKSLVCRDQHWAAPAVAFFSHLRYIYFFYPYHSVRPTSIYFPLFPVPPRSLFVIPGTLPPICVLRSACAATDVLSGDLFRTSLHANYPCLLEHLHTRRGNISPFETSLKEFASHGCVHERAFQSQGGCGGSSRKNEARCSRGSRKNKGRCSLR
ncbi:hypothetical protein NDU88_001510, partial [Pleurodeles waltl]